MKKPRLQAIEFIRGISMLGVVAIHVGSQHLLAVGGANMHMIALLEIASRFSVPIFFFISAFGMFYNLDISKPFNYGEYLRRRGKTVLVPYMVWSIIYMLHNAWVAGATAGLTLYGLCFNLFFGTASYQLYFMVLLLWFYLLMPVWLWLVRRINLAGLAALLLFQIAFDYWCEHLINPLAYESAIVQTLLNNRLNYWFLCYVFIFVLGGYLAVHSERFMVFMQQYRGRIVAGFWASLTSLLGYYYYLLLVRGYTPLEGVFTAHQLCPLGIIYTLAASLFFFTIFTLWRLPEGLKPVLGLLGRHSYFMYLAHPILITHLAFAFANRGIVLGVKGTIAFYCCVVAATLLAAIVMRSLGDKLPQLNQWTIGVYKRK